MRAMRLMDQKDARLPSRSRAPVIWPWILIFAAWTVVLLAVLTKQTFLINHNYLLTQSHLPWLVALAVFLVCWQVMTVGNDAGEEIVTGQLLPDVIRMAGQKSMSAVSDMR